MVRHSRPPEQQWKTLKLLGRSDAMMALRDDICCYARSNAPILIVGEAGTGKENVARACHVLSVRSGQPFQVAQCSAITETLLESELFGHVKGAFTGANERRIGRFEAADHGTLFLDEVGTLAKSTQVKLLRVLQERCIERVGDNATVAIDIRVIAATNENLDEALRADRIRKDFYSRLAHLEIKVPPLRDRQDDVILLAETFLEHECSENGKGRKPLSEGARRRLISHQWPGNVRELQGVVSRAAARVDDEAPCVDEDLIVFDNRQRLADAPLAIVAGRGCATDGLRERVTQKTVDLLLNGKKPFEGVLKGSAEISELLGEVIEGVVDGAARYLETDAGSLLRRNGGVGMILERLGLSPRSGGKSLLAQRIEAAVKSRVNQAAQTTS